MSITLSTINSRHFDGNIAKSWTCDLVDQRGSLLIFVGKFDREINHEHLGHIKEGTISYEYYWLDRWYNVFRFHEADGSIRNYYCNITMPPVFEGGTLDYVDLDIDILVGKDLTYTILDSEEFELSAAKFDFSEDVRAKTFGAVKDVIAMVEQRHFPFDR